MARNCPHRSQTYEREGHPNDTMDWNRFGVGLAKEHDIILFMDEILQHLAQLKADK